MRKQKWIINVVLLAVAVVLGLKLRGDWVRTTQQQKASDAFEKAAAPAAGAPNWAAGPVPGAELIAQNNLFSPDRNNVQEQPAELKPLPPDPLLLGSMNVGSGPIALMVDGAAQPGTPAHPVRLGEMIGEYKLVKVGDTFAMVEYQGQQKRVEVQTSPHQINGSVPVASTATAQPATQQTKPGPSTGGWTGSAGAERQCPAVQGRHQHREPRFALLLRHVRSRCKRHLSGRHGYGWLEKSRAPLAVRGKTSLVGESEMTRLMKNLSLRNLLAASQPRYWLAIFLTVALLGQTAPPAPQPVTPAASPQPPQAAPVQTAPAPAVPDGNANISLNLPNADLMQVVSIIAGELKMNWVADPTVKGTVTINTMGEVKRSDLLPLLQAILRVNGATAVENSGLWRIVPIKDANHAAISPTLDAKKFPVDDRLMLDLIPLHFASAVDLSHLLSNYLSDAGSIVVHEAGNILLITDTSRSLERLVELINLFDSDAFAGQRVQLFPAKNSTARALALDLQTVFAAYALSGKSPIQFLPVERLNGVLVISANPESFVEVAKWVEKLDVITKSGGTRNYVYKVQNALAEDLASVLVQLYGGYVSSSPRSQRTGSGRTGGFPSGSSGTSGMGGTPGMGGSFGTGGMGGTSGMGGSFGTGGAGGLQSQGMQQQQGGSAFSGGGLASASGAAPTRLAGTPQAAGGTEQPYGPRIVPDSVNNNLIVQCTPQEWEDIKATLKDLDILPRQVLIEAKVFEVDLTGELDMGVTAFLQARDATNRQLTVCLRRAPPALPY